MLLQIDIANFRWKLQSTTSALTTAENRLNAEHQSRIQSEQRSGDLQAEIDQMLSKDYPWVVSFSSRVMFISSSSSGAEC